MASGAFASGSLASGAGTDGWNVTEGTKADAAWSSGSGSIVALLKEAVNGINGPIPPATAPYGIIGGVISGADTYNTVAASQSTQALTGGSGGATGDYLSHCTVLPNFDLSWSRDDHRQRDDDICFPWRIIEPLQPGASPIPIGAVSTSGAWKVTGANLTAVCIGKFH